MLNQDGDTVKLRMRGGSFDVVRASDGDAIRAVLLRVFEQLAVPRSIKKGKTGNGSAVIANLFNLSGSVVELKDITIVRRLKRRFRGKASPSAEMNVQPPERGQRGLAVEVAIFPGQARAPEISLHTLI